MSLLTKLREQFDPSLRLIVGDTIEISIQAKATVLEDMGDKWRLQLHMLGGLVVSVPKDDVRRTP